MATGSWQTKRLRVTSLDLDAKNPRLGRETLSRAPRDIIQHLFEHDKALEVAQSIASRGYYPNEPLLAIRERGKVIVVEGNRRLAALKALREPGLLDGRLGRQVARLSRGITHPEAVANVPVTIAPNRRATDRQIAGRHIQRPVLPWQRENRASFILEKLEEGYDNDELRDELGFTLTDIQKARQTRAIADMARSLDLPEEVKAKLDKPRVKLFTTLERVFDSTEGRKALMVQPDPEHGLRGTTTRGEFVRGFKKLVADVVLGKASSRTLNTSDNIKAYFAKWNAKERPAKKRGSFVPADVIQGRSTASTSRQQQPKRTPKKTKQPLKTVLPSDLKIRIDNDRLIDIRRELIRLDRTKYPNAGAVLLRVFFELAVMDYLTRTGELAKLMADLKKKNVHLPFDVPTMKHLAKPLLRLAKKHLTSSEAQAVGKVIRRDRAAPFSLSDLHAFVHHATDPPTERDIWQFWIRTEPLFRLMLEQTE